MTKRYILSARCGTCEHQHSMGGCKACQSAGGNCLGWTAHTDDIAGAEEQELREILELGAKPSLSVFESRGVLKALVKFEEALYAGLDSKPVVAAVQLGPCRKTFSADQRLLRVSALNVSEDFWETKVDAAAALDALAVVAQDWYRLSCELDPGRPAMAWILAATGVVIGRTGSQDIHVATGGDIDGRIYRAFRRIDSGEVSPGAITYAPGWAQLLRGCIDTSKREEAAAVINRDRLDDAECAVMQLNLVTRLLIEKSLSAQ